MTVTRLAALRIDCPEWYARPDFREWLNNTEQPPLATWHRVGEGPSEFSDVFMTFDNGEGSDADLGDGPGLRGCLPEDIWKEISRLCKKAGITYGVIWLSNVGD